MRRELRCILLGLMILIPASGLFARALHKQGQQYITKEKSGAYIESAAGVKADSSYLDTADQPGVLRAVTFLAGDIANVSVARPKVVQKVKAPKGAILVGTLG